MSENYFENLPEEINEIILSYLSLNELLNLSETCKFMNELIGRSRNCMKQIWIKFYTFKLRDLQSLEKSTRQYEKLKVNRVKENDHFEFLKKLNKQWRRMLIYNCEFKQYPQFSEMFTFCSDTIIELELSDIQILNNEYQISAIDLTEIRRIMFRNVPSTTIELFLGKNSKLENLAFDIAHEISGRGQSLGQIMRELIEKSENLKILQIGPNYIKHYFEIEDYDFMKFKFNLKKLMLKFPIVPETSEIIESNICKMLESQKQIDWILLWELHSSKVLSTAWNCLPLVNHFTLLGLEDLFDEYMEFDLQENNKIIHLEMISRRIQLSKLKIFLKAAPNLKILHVFSLTEYVLNLVIKSHFGIRELRYETIDEGILEMYENERNSDNNEINKNINLCKVLFWKDAAKPFLVDPLFWHS